MAEMVEAPWLAANRDKEFRILHPTWGHMAKAWSAGYEEIHIRYNRKKRKRMRS
jgi:hypothetical protein